MPTDATFCSNYLTTTAHQLYLLAQRMCLGNVNDDDCKPNTVLYNDKSKRSQREQTSYSTSTANQTETVQPDCQQAGTLPTLPVSYLLHENCLSLVVSDLPTNCRAYLQRPTDSKTFLFVIL